MRKSGIFKWVDFLELSEHLGLDAKNSSLIPAVTSGENNIFSSTSNAILEAGLEEKWYHHKMSVSWKPATWGWAELYWFVQLSDWNAHQSPGQTTTDSLSRSWPEPCEGRLLWCTSHIPSCFGASESPALLWSWACCCRNKANPFPSLLCE